VSDDGGDRGRLELIVAIGLLLAFAVLIGVMALRRPVRVDHVTADSRAALPDMRLDLNRASAAELSLLPGVGPTLAQRIIETREQRGPFAATAELEDVPGVGPATLAGIRPFVVVGPGPD
jgi:competence ComEA-like helix-hairpin-helix protein